MKKAAAPDNQPMSSNKLFEPTHYDNNSDDSDNGEGTSYSTNVSNSTNSSRVDQNFTKLRRNNTDSLIEFLMNDEEFTDMNIDESCYNKLQEEEIIDNSFIRLCKDDLKECGLKIA
ncbi:12380_t:CDS:2 [Gigaspora margarita]|uniref:12380_t:CDS:1 n=1 Tax=Gigaspora margarita TaxID=4874 RepID=A0ABN7V7G9_GIGMA|nr:12380_t:CDS:2 [Gigaspora margarita]